MNKRTEQTRWTPKRLLSLLMALIMTLSLLPTAALAADGDAPTLGTSAANPVVITFSSNQFATADTSPITTQISEEGSTPYTVTFKPQIQFVDSNGKGTASTFIYQSGIPFKPGVSISTNANEEKTIGQYTYTVQQVNADGTGAPNTTIVTNNIRGTSKIPVTSSLSCGGSDFSAKALENNMIRLKYTVYEGDSVDDSKRVGQVYVGITGIAVTDIKYNVSYNIESGGAWVGNEIVDQTTIDADERGNASYTIPADAKATKNNATFAGWQASGGATGTYQPGQIIESINADITLTAKYEQNYTITFQSEYSGASGLMTSTTSNGTKYTVPVEPTMYGFTFAGWKVTKTGGTLTATVAKGTDGKWVVDGIDSDITLTAQWTKDGTTPAGSHKVTFLAGAADAYIPFPTPATVADGANYTIPATPPTREGYTFAGWSDEQGNTYQAGREITNVTTDIVLSAMWQQEMVTVTFPAATGTVGSTDVLPAGVSYHTAFGTKPTTGPVAKGSDVTFRLFLDDLSLDPATLHVFANGLELLGTSINSYNNCYEYTVHNVTVDTKITVYPPTAKTFTVMMPVGHFTAQITSVSNDGSTIAADGISASIVHGGSYTFTVTPDEGYTVKRVAVNGATINTTNGSYTVSKVTTAQTVEVVVDELPVYIVIYNSNNSQYAFQRVTAGSKAALPAAPKVEGYTFGGWYTKQNGEGEQFTDTTAITGDITVYAKLTANTYTITYDLNGDGATGTFPNQLKTHGLAEKLSETVPTRVGYTFLGWGTTASATAASYQPGDMYSVDGDITLYAVWEINKYTVTLPGGAGYTTAPTGTNSVDWGSNFTFTVIVDREYAAKEPTVKYSTDGGMNWTVTDGAGAVSNNSAATWTYTIQNVKTNYIVSIDVARNTTYTVSFITATLDNGTVTVGDAFLKQSVEHGYYAPTPAAPERVGFKFLGYYAKKDTATSTMADYESFPFEQQILKDTNIYAIYAPITPAITWTAPITADGYTIEVKGTKAGETTESTLNSGDKVAYGSKVTFTITVAEGYDASKMQVGVNGILYAPNEKNGNVYTYEFIAKEDTKITVTGIERKTITINYFANAGDDVASVPGPQTDVKYYINETGVENSNIINFTPVRTGYNFLGWCENPAPTGEKTYNNQKLVKFGENAVYQPGDTATFTKDTNLYAIWEATELKVDLTFSDTALHTGAYDIQYEGKTFTLNAQLSARAKGSMIFKMGTTDSIDDAKEIGRVSNINGDSASLAVTTDKYITPADSNFKYYWVEFQAEQDEGFTDCKAGPIKLKIFSRAITWAPLETGNKDTLTIKQGNEAKDSMIAGQTYTLAVDTSKITGLEALDSNKPPVLGTDYKIVWQYKKTATSDWETVNGEFTDTNEYQVTPAESGYEFRAKIYPMGDLYNTAAKFDADGKYLDNQYDSCLYTNTTKSNHQATATTLAITGAETEANNVFINGSKPFATLPGFDSNGSHLAQFEGQAVTLTAKVTKDGGTGVETGKVSFYRLASTDATGTQTWELISTVDVQTAGDNTGVASTTYTMGTYDSTSAGASATTNKETFKAVYVANETYEKSETDGNADVYIKSAKLMTPVIESELEGTNGAKATTYSKDLTGLLAGVQHEFKLRQTGAEATTGDWSVVALDGRTVDATNYDIKWLKTTGSNEQEVDATGTNQIKVDENKVDDRYRVKLTGKGVFAGSEATSKDAVIGTKQDVTVTVKAIDAITKTPETDVYQLNEITLTATVAAAKGADATMKPTGTVTFYYLEEGATNKWIELGTSTLTKDAQSTQGEMIATIQTTKLPVAKTTYTSLPSKITAVYSGDDTFQQNQTFTKDTASTKDLVFGTIANVNGNTTNNVEVTVRSSVVKGCADANKAVTTLSDTGIHISADGLAAHEGLVTLKLDEVYTLDAKKAYSKLLAGTDYTVQWQILSSASAYNNGGDYSSANAWVNIDGATDTTYTLTTVEQDAAYRAVITVANEPITKGSFTEIEQDANALLNGHKQYYSNVLCAADGQTTIDVLIDTNGRGTNKEGITEGETVNVNVFLSGATQATPIADVTVKIENDTAKGNNETYSTTLTGSTVNGWNVFPWNTVGVAPGFYKVTVSSKSNTGYADETVTRSLIVRESSYDFEVGNTNPTYNGRTQGLTVALNGFGFNGTGINEAANKSWTVKYYDKGNNLVEPTQAGTYKAVVTLPASAYWTEQTKTVDFTIKQRSVSIADAIAQAKVYDGTTDVNIVEVMLNDAVTDQTTNGTGLPTNNVGIINGDSIYAVATAAALEKANAGENKFTISAIDLLGDDANNYVWNEAPYTEDIYVSRSQVYGEHGTLELKQGETFPADKVIKMIDQSGREITLGTGTEDYTLTFYYHSDTKIEKTTDISKLGLYTVVARPNQANYKSGVTMKFEVVNDANTYTPAAEPKPSTLIDLTNTATMYNPMGNVGVTATSSQGNTVEVKYQNGTDWSTDVPANAGRYLVKATDAISGDVAYGIYTITKAHPSIGITAAEATYNSMPYTGATPDLTKATENPEHYLTYAGDVAIGYNTPADGNVDEQAPVDAGTYTVTLHVNETENYTAHEISKSFTIEKKPLTIEAKKVGTWQYGSMPGFYASYEGLAGDVNDSTPDTSLRDVQIAPELLFNPTSNNQSNYSNDALDQVGKIIIRPVDALSKNYELTPVDGEFTKNEEDPQPTLSILGLPQNGKSADVTVYYGDEIQLSAYGNYLARRNTSSFLKWEITNSTLTNGSVSIDENNILHVNGVGTFTVKLTRGTARQAITTEITVTAIQKEAKIALKNVDKVYNGASQTYAYEGNVTVHDELYQPIGNFVDSKLMRTNTARTDVGTQITTAKVTGAWAYQSETYGGKFTINDKDATVAPVAQSTVYGTLEAFDATKCTVTGKAGSVDPVTGVNVASQTDAYNRLDVHDGYEILVAGTENMNYNVKYTTDHNDTAKNADDSAVTTYGGMKLYSTTTKAKNELNDATVYGEQANDLDWILDAVKSTTRDSVDYADNLADFDLTDTTGIFIKQDKDDCVGNAKTYKAANREEGNTSSTALAADRTATDTAKDDNYELKFGSVTNAKAANYTLANAEVKNAEGTMTAPTGTVGFIGAAATSDNLIEGSANIAQRPIKLEQAVTDAQLYWRLPQSQLYTALVNILKAEENSVGRGLAKGHTIEDLDLSFTIKVGSTTYNVAKDGTDAINFAATGNATVTATVGDTNYKLEGGQYQFDIVLKNIQIEATYTTKTFTGFTVLIKVHNENGTITPLNDAKGLSYKIFKKTGNTIDKTTAYASGTLTYQNRTAYDDKGGLCGVFTATYPQLPLLNSGETYFIQMYEYGVELKTNS